MAIQMGKLAYIDRHLRRILFANESNFMYSLSVDCMEVLSEFSLIGEP